MLCYYCQDSRWPSLAGCQKMNLSAEGQGILFYFILFYSNPSTQYGLENLSEEFVGTSIFWNFVLTTKYNFLGNIVIQQSGKHIVN